MARDRLSMKKDNGVRGEMSLPQWSFERSVSSMRILTGFGVDQGIRAQALLAGIPA